MLSINQCGNRLHFCRCRVTISGWSIFSIFCLMMGILSMLNTSVDVGCSLRRVAQVAAWAFVLTWISTMFPVKAATKPAPQIDAGHASFCSNAIRNPDGSWWVLNSIKVQQLPVGSGDVTTIAAGVTVKPGETGQGGALAMRLAHFCSRQF